MIPGVRILDAVGVSRTLGREDYGDLVAGRAPRGSRRRATATVTVSVVPEDPALSRAPRSRSRSSAGDRRRRAARRRSRGRGRRGRRSPTASYTVTRRRRSSPSSPACGSRRPRSPRRRSISSHRSRLPCRPTTDFAWLAAAPRAARGHPVHDRARRRPARHGRQPVRHPSVEVLLEAQGGSGRLDSSSRRTARRRPTSSRD